MLCCLSRLSVGQSCDLKEARSLAVALSRDPSELEVRKCGRIPELWIAGRRAGKLSLSHHGSVVGFAWEAPK